MEGGLILPRVDGVTSWGNMSALLEKTQSSDSLSTVSPFCLPH